MNLSVNELITKVFVEQQVLWRFQCYHTPPKGRSMPKVQDHGNWKYLWEYFKIAMGYGIIRGVLGAFGVGNQMINF